MLCQGHILDGKYKVMDVLGKGGMSTVYLCENMRLENLWAIKEVPSDLKYQVDFLTEPNILKKLSHPGIPRIIDIFNENDNLYIVEDYIKGRTLEKIVKTEGPLSLEKICSIGMNICEILSYLHSFNPPIIYRDLKPSNIMVNEDGRVVLIDFGISRVYKKGQIEDTVFMGSRGYAAPEQFGNAQSGRETDIYGLGATLFFMIYGRAPLSISEPLKDESYNENIDRGLSEIIKKSMQIEMEKRFRDALSLKEALNNVLIKSSSTRMLNNEGMTPEECIGAQTEAIKEESFEKTRFLNISEDAAQTIQAGFGNKGFEKTVLMDNKREKPLNKGKILKRTIIAVLIIIALIGCTKLLGFAWSKKSSKQIEPQKPEKIQEVKVDDTKAKIENLNRDEIIEGVIYRNSPSISKTLSDNKSDEKKKGKGKKNEENRDSRINYLLYEVRPQANVRKYNKKIIFKLEKVEVVNDIFVAYITIENNSDKAISITHENSTILKDSRGNLLSPYTSLSTDISSIGPGETKKDIKIVFKGFSMNTDFIILCMSVKMDDPVFTNRNVNLKVNIK